MRKLEPYLLGLAMGIAYGIGGWQTALSILFAYYGIIAGLLGLLSFIPKPKEEKWKT
jgi:hypothetical protein